MPEAGSQQHSPAPTGASAADRATERLTWVLGWCFALGVGVTAATVILYVRTFGPHLSADHERWNQAGSFFGGILGPTFSFLALFALLFTVILQREQLSLARTQLAGANAGLALSQSTFARQQFEGTFFELLKLARELQGRFVAQTGFMLSVDKVDVVEKEGAAALDSYAGSVDHRVLDRGDYPGWTEADKARQLVRVFRNDFYLKQPSAFGPYFRCLYQTFKHVSESPLSDQDKKRFANIARGQISEGAVLLLAVNGLTDVGHNFIRYIEEFGLLEHMHRDYLARHQQALLEGYHARAFMGGAQRDALPMQAPKQGQDFFMGSSDAA